ncbi:MAG: hypothetical protein K2N22_02435, partial [Clostridia bacterium]|nr:hypothetical protein [Clostridia bacterium]
MTENFLKEIHSLDNLNNAILDSVVLDGKTVTVKLITDKVYTEADKAGALAAAKKMVPEIFDCKVEIVKLTPDPEMVRRKILEDIENN